MKHPTITRHPVESSCIASIGYAEPAATLEVEFRSGAVYRYFTVPQAVHAELLTSASKGAYLNRFIKGRYPEVRHMPPEPSAGPVSRRRSSLPSLGAHHEAGRRS